MIDIQVTCACGAVLVPESMLGNRQGTHYGVKLKIKPCAHCRQAAYLKGNADAHDKYMNSLHSKG